MAPKKANVAGGAQVAGTAEQIAAEANSRQLRKLAITGGVLCAQPSTDGTSLQPSKALSKCDGKDIIKKSSSRKNRYLMVFNAQLAPAAGGRMGTLAQLDSRNPVLYIDFPCGGRLKFFGTLTFPKSKYLVLKPGGAAVLCEDVFESMVVFSEAWWIGTAGENPEEKQLDIPMNMARPHTSHDRGYGASAKEGEVGGSKAAASRASPQDAGAHNLSQDETGLSQPQRRRQAQRRAAAHESHDEVSEDEGEEEDGSSGTSGSGDDGGAGTLGAVQRAARPTARGVGALLEAAPVRHGAEAGSTGATPTRQLARRAATRRTYTTPAQEPDEDGSNGDGSSDTDGSQGTTSGTDDGSDVARHRGSAPKGAKSLSMTAAKVNGAASAAKSGGGCSKVKPLRPAGRAAAATTEDPAAPAAVQPRTKAAAATSQGGDVAAASSGDGDVADKTQDQVSKPVAKRVPAGKARPALVTVDGADDEDDGIGGHKHRCAQGQPGKRSAGKAAATPWPAGKRSREVADFDTDSPSTASEDDNKDDDVHGNNGKGGTKLTAKAPLKKGTPGTAVSGKEAAAGRRVVARGGPARKKVKAASDDDDDNKGDEPELRLPALTRARRTPRKALPCAGSAEEGSSTAGDTMDDDSDFAI